MPEWQDLQLSDLGEIFDGPHATPERSTDGPYFMNIASLSHGRLNLSLSDHVNESDFTKWTRRVTPRADDLLFSYETRLGEAALMPSGIRACLGRRMALLRPNSAVVDPRFLLYSYLAPDFQSVIEHNTIHGATVNRIPLNRMGNWKLKIPSLPEQRAIAEVLGALDDKIAANTALAATAEMLAALTYDSAVASWPRFPLRNVLDPVLGGTPPRARDEYWAGGDHLWISARDITTAPSRVVLDTTEKITAAAVSRTKAKPLPAGSVILTARGTVGEVGRLAKPASFNQSCYGFRPETLPPGLLYYSVLRAAERAKVVAHGSVFDTITKATFEHLDLAWDAEQAPGAESRVAPLLELITSCIVENRTLAATRDALLPQLMSGKLRVRDAEVAASEAGA